MIQTQLKSYDADENAEFASNSVHTIQVTMQYQDLVSQFNTTMMGSISGAEALADYGDIDLITAPSSDPINQRHCIFNMDTENDYKEVGCFRFFSEDGREVTISSEEAHKYIVRLEIIGFKEGEDDEDE